MRLRLVLAALLGAATATAVSSARLRRRRVNEGTVPARPIVGRFINPDGPYVTYTVPAPDVHIDPPGGLADYVRDGTLVRRPTSCSVVGCTSPSHYAAAADDTPITWGD